MIKKFLFVVSIAALLIGNFSVAAEASVFTAWADTNSDGFRDLYLGDLHAYQGTPTGRNNYNYFSASGHPIHGPGLGNNANRLKIFVYERTTNDRAFINFIAGRDNGGTQHSFDFDIRITGATTDPRVIRGDENGEVDEIAADLFRGDWRFNNNSDGGVFGPLLGPWEARITPGDSTLNRHIFASNGTSNIRFDNLNYDHYFITTAPVPEPATMLLLSSGLIGGAFMRKRRSK